MNFTLPQPERADVKPWPHIDQSPKRKGLVCAQGIINFAPNGPQDGGLVVVRGSHNLIAEYFKKHGMPPEPRTWGPEDYFSFIAEEVDWFKEAGCEVVKVCADPGDLIIWDSRTIHYNRLPESQQVRSIVCKIGPPPPPTRHILSRRLLTGWHTKDACYAPARFASEKDLKLKAQLFHERKPTVSIRFAVGPEKHIH